MSRRPATLDRRAAAISAAVSVLALAALPAPALAGTVSAARGGSSSGASTTNVRYIATPAERNRLSVTRAESAVVVRDAVGVAVGAGCARPEPADPTLAHCPDGVDLHFVDVELGDGDDQVTLRLKPGDEASVRGGKGDDVLLGGAESDIFESEAKADGSDTIRGGPGTGDEVSYARRTAPLAVDADGRRDDGERGERDLIGADVEGLIGGRARDRLRQA